MMKNSIARTTAMLLLPSVLAAATAAACAPPEEVIPQPARVTKADAPEILDLVEALPFGFREADAASRGVSREALGLGPDATSVWAYQSSQPYQFLYSYIRIIESEIDQRRASLELNDEETIRLAVRSFFQGAVDRNDEVEFTEPEIQVSYPKIANGGVLAEGQMEMDDYTLRMATLGFRSSDPRAFVYVQSWYVSTIPPQPVLAMGEEIESRIKDFGQ
jgi:hypothetical protein